MSGGSWEYPYYKFEDVADRLAQSKCPLRRALGERIRLIATALHAIEWVDSGDCSPPHDIDAIKLALGDSWTIDSLRQSFAGAEEAMKELGVALKEAKSALRPPSE